MLGFSLSWPLHALTLEGIRDFLHRIKVPTLVVTSGSERCSAVGIVGTKYIHGVDTSEQRWALLNPTVSSFSVYIKTSRKWLWWRKVIPVSGGFIAVRVRRLPQSVFVKGREGRSYLPSVILIDNLPYSTSSDRITQVAGGRKVTFV